jgi:hypothetical protein
MEISFLSPQYLWPMAFFLSGLYEEWKFFKGHKNGLETLEARSSTNRIRMEGRLTAFVYLFGMFLMTMSPVWFLIQFIVFLFVIKSFWGTPPKWFLWTDSIVSTLILLVCLFHYNLKFIADAIIFVIRLFR